MQYVSLLNLDLGYQASLFLLIAVYSLIGVIIMLGCALLCNYVFKLDIKKELLVDHNNAVGVMLAGLFIAIAIIVAASIVG